MSRRSTSIKVPGREEVEPPNEVNTRDIKMTAPTQSSSSSYASPTVLSDDETGDLEQDNEDAEASPSSAVHEDTELLASYPIYLSTSLPPSSQLHLLQYPTYPRKQPLQVPDSSRQRGLVRAIRWRPKAGWIHIELPLDLRRSVYDEERGREMAKGVPMAGGEIGIKNKGAGDSDADNEEGGPPLGRRKKKRPLQPKIEDNETMGLDKKLERIRLESDVMPNMTRYCVGVMRDQALHLTHLDRVVQLRPSMHYLDGLDVLEAQAKRSTARALDIEGESDVERTEAERAKEQAAKKKKVMSYNVSFQGEGGRRGSAGPVGAGMSDKDHLMASKRRAEAEEWVDLEWRDMHGTQHRIEVLDVFSSQLFAGSKTALKCKTKPRDYLP